MSGRNSSSAARTVAMVPGVGMVTVLKCTARSQTTSPASTGASSPSPW